MWTVCRQKNHKLHSYVVSIVNKNICKMNAEERANFPLKEWISKSRMDLNQHFQHKWGISYHQATWIPHTLYWSKEKANPSPPAFHSFLPFLLWLSQFFLSSFRKFSSKHLASCMWQKKLRSSLERVYFWITDKPTELSDLSSSWNLGWSPKSLFSTEQP